jgi:hypothetical protein
VDTNEKTRWLTLLSSHVPKLTELRELGSYHAVVVAGERPWWYAMWKLGDSMQSLIEEMAFLVPGFV